MTKGNDSSVPRGYAEVAAPEADNTPVVPRERLTTGREVVFLHSATLPARAGRGASKLHKFTDVATGAEFKLWGSAVLDAKLNLVGRNEKIFLRYDGQSEHPTNPAKTQHNFTVGRSQVTAENAKVANGVLPF